MNSIVFNKIDETDTNQLLKEIDRLTCEINKYNIFSIPSPKHIKREDYSNINDYIKAKGLFREAYKKAYYNIDNEIKRLRDLNTNICYERKKKEDEKKLEEGTFYNHDEEEYLKAVKKYKQISRKDHDEKYYQRNKEKIKQKAIIKKYKEQQKQNQLLNNIYIKHLILTNEIIKPVCLCCRRTDVTDFNTLKKHSKSVKHQLFKSIISLVHCKRENKKIKIVIDKINKELIEFKKNIRMKNHNDESVVIMNKTDKDVINYYNDIVDETDENNYIIREPYINKVEYNNQYRDKVLLLKIRKVNIKKVNH